MRYLYFINILIFFHHISLCYPLFPRIFCLLSRCSWVRCSDSHVIPFCTRQIVANAEPCRAILRNFCVSSEFQHQLCFYGMFIRTIMGIQRWWAYKSLWQRIGDSYDHPSIWANLLYFLTFLTMARHTSDFTGSWQISSGIGQSIKIWRGWCFTKKCKDYKKNETKTFMKTLGFSPGGTVKTLYMPLSDLGAKGPEIPQVLRRLIEALFHCFPGHFALGRPYGAKKTQKLQQNYPGKRPQTVWRE